jgi:hypothetical protein
LDVVLDQALGKFRYIEAFDIAKPLDWRCPVVPIMRE